MIDHNSVSSVTVSPAGIASVINTALAITPTGETIHFITTSTRVLYDKLPTDKYTSRSASNNTYIDENFVVRPRLSTTQTRGQIIPRVGQDQYSNANGVIFIIKYNFNVLNVENILDIWSTAGLSVILKRHLTTIFRSGQIVYKYGDLIIHNVGQAYSYEQLTLTAEFVGVKTATSQYVSRTLYNETNDSGTTINILPTGTFLLNCEQGINVFEIGTVCSYTKPSQGKYISNTNLFASLVPTLQEFYAMDGLECSIIYKPLGLGTHSLTSLIVGPILQTETNGAVDVVSNYVTSTGPGVLYIRGRNITYRFQF